MVGVSALLDPLQVKGTRWPSRVVMAPMTRMRARDHDAMPSPLMRDFYLQRASAGLILTEGTQTSPTSKGYARTPGIFSHAQTEAWTEIVQLVHAAGGRIAVQLLHVGRVSHPDLLGGLLPGSASAEAFEDFVSVERADGTIEWLPCPVPRALDLQEIEAVIDEFRRAASNAIAAGFDFIEVHAAHGYLLHQFLSIESNRRNDQYGGPLENRAQLALDVLDTVIGVAGADRVGLRVSPVGSFSGLSDVGGIEDAIFLARQASKRGVAWLHVSGPDWAGGPSMSDDVRAVLRNSFDGVVIAAGGFDPAKAQRAVALGLTDAVAFGRLFAANPDLPARLRSVGPLNRPNSKTFYDGGATGYTDYPLLDSSLS